ncbi:putative membrane protein YfcA [Bacillus sp. RC218]
MNMKPVLKNIIISLVFSIVGVCWSLFVFFMLDADWLLIWIGVLMAYLSLYIVIGLYSRKTYDSKFAKVLLKTIITTFSFGVLGISFGVVHEILGPLSLTLMTWYWFLMLFLYLIPIILLVILVFVNRKNHNFPGVYSILILLNILLTLWPLFWPLFITFMATGMNASAGW